MPHTEHDFDAAYGPIATKLKAEFGEPAAKRIAELIAPAVQSLVSGLLARIEATVREEDEQSKAAYLAWHAKTFP